MITSPGRMYITAVVAALLCLVFLWWAVQTAWLGSFPGREHLGYAYWAYGQLAASILFGVVSVVAVVRGKRSRRTSRDERHK